MNPVNQMSRLKDLLLLPPVIYCGATGNILLTMLLTSYVWDAVSGNPVWLFPWACGVPLVNVIPVIIWRMSMPDPTEYPKVSRMRFFGDQHKFSSWVYAVASANMFFWIVFAWWVKTISPEASPLFFYGVTLAFVCNFVPLWRWLIIR